MCVWSTIWRITASKGYAWPVLQSQTNYLRQKEPKQQGGCVWLYPSRKRQNQEKKTARTEWQCACFSVHYSMTECMFDVLIQSYKEAKHFCNIKVRCDKLEMPGMAGLHRVCEGVWSSSKQRRGKQMLSAHKAEWKAWLYTTLRIMAAATLVLTVRLNQWFITAVTGVKQH